MYCIPCNKDIEWIEVHLIQNHNTTLLQYLVDGFQVATVEPEELVTCKLCGSRIKWLQDHLLNKHSGTKLVNYVYEFYMSEAAIQEQVEQYKHAASLLEPIKRPSVGRLQELSDPDFEVLNFQQGKERFDTIFHRYKKKIQTQAYKSYRLVSGLAGQAEGVKELEQELYGVLVLAARTYDSDRAKFNTHLWNCIKTHLSTIANYNQAGKRNYTLVSADDLLSNSEEIQQDSGDKISLLAYLNDSSDGAYENSTRFMELLSSIKRLELTPIQELIIQCLLNDLTKSQIAELLLINVEEINRVCTGLRDNKELKRILSK